MTTVARSSSTNRILSLKTDQQECFRCDIHSKEVLESLHARMDLCDVELIAGRSGTRIAAHRLILIVCSEYFSTLFSESSSQPQQREIMLTEVDEDALAKLINYCYTGSIVIEANTIEALITTAKHLQFRKALEGCCKFLQYHLEPSNCMAVAFFAEQLNLEELLKAAKTFIIQNFEEASHYADFFLLNSKQLADIIISDDLAVPSEEFVFRTVMMWIEYDPENRRQYFAELLAQVRLPLLQPSFLTEMVEPLCNTFESLKLFATAIKSHHVERGESCIQQRRSFRNLMLIYNTSELNDNLAIAGYNLRTKEWTIMKTLIEHRQDFAVIQRDDNLFVIGGSSKGMPVNTVTSLKLSNITSTTVAPLRTSRKNHSIALLNGSIYVIGGDDGHKFLNSVERWDPTSATWSYAAPMKTARCCSGAAVINDQLYVCGGYETGTFVVASMECYDAVENSWRSIASMKVERYSHCLTAYKGYLLAVGGYRNGSSNIPVERYDIITDTWTTIDCSPLIYGYTRCITLGPDVFIYNNSKFLFIFSEVNCDKLMLQLLPNSSVSLMNFYCAEFFGTTHVVIPRGN